MCHNKLIRAVWLLLLFHGLAAADNSHDEAAKKRQQLHESFWKTSTGNDEVACGKEAHGLPNLAALKAYTSETIRLRGPDDLGKTIKKLTQLNPNLKGPLTTKMEACNGKPNPEMCRLLAYWDGNEEASQRALSLYYGTGIVLRHESNAKAFKAFTIAELRTIERAIRRYPFELRRKWKVERDPYTNPEGDFVIVKQMGEENALSGAASFNGLLVLSTPVLDAFTPGKKRPAGTLRVDASVHAVIHELAHALDSTWFEGRKLPPKEEFKQGVLAYRYRNLPALSSHETFRDLRSKTRQPKFPWDPYLGAEGAEGIDNGVYTKNPSEEFAEYISHYLLNGKALKRDAPRVYEYLKKTVFDGREYEALEDCRGGLFEKN